MMNLLKKLLNAVFKQDAHVHTFETLTSGPPKRIAGEERHGHDLNGDRRLGPAQGPESSHTHPVEMVSTGSQIGTSSGPLAPTEKGDLDDSVLLALAALGFEVSKKGYKDPEKKKEIEKAVLKQEGSRIQSLVFDKKKFTAAQARAWADRHEFKSSKVDETGTSFRLRQEDPGKFTRIRTIDIPGAGGVQAVIGITADAVRKIFENDEIDIIEKLDEQRIVLGIVLEPEEVDAQKDIASEDEIRRAAHGFMKKSRTIGLGHIKKSKADLVESFIAPVDFEINGVNGKQNVKKGSWLIAVHVPDDDEWAQVKKKDFNAFSIGGIGKRESEA